MKRSNRVITILGFVLSLYSGNIGSLQGYFMEVVHAEGAANDVIEINERNFPKGKGRQLKDVFTGEKC